MMKLFPHLALATASLTLSFATVCASSASAAILNYALTVDSSTAKGQGFFSFDDSTFSNDNIPVAPIKSLVFQFDNDPNIYTEKDDIGYPDYPVAFTTVSLTDTAPIGLLYNFLDKTNPALNYEIAGTLFSVDSTTFNNGTVSYRQVPEPSSLGGTLMFLTIGWFMKKKIVSVKKVKC
ncbi:PEP-CTERM sorting domain-containing protein [Nostoc sp.]|uniref:PEP-CTERM sorting domain-containing protein n=1 Tax=Nostoc sp. TaxID=1180 RepID=UPI002FF59577